jgi:hypothetical protein
VFSGVIAETLFSILAIRVIRIALRVALALWVWSFSDEFLSWRNVGSSFFFFEFSLETGSFVFDFGHRNGAIVRLDYCSGLLLDRPLESR